MIKYIDCDGVILDTERTFFSRYIKLKEENPSMNDKEYIDSLDWTTILEESPVIAEAIDILNNYDPKGVNILTKIFTLKEAKAKVEYFRSRGVKNIIIFVTPKFRKSEVVIPKGNILVDDSDTNLREWQDLSGIPIHFTLSDQSPYPSTRTLQSVLDGTILEDERIRLVLEQNYDRI